MQPSGPVESCKPDLGLSEFKKSIWRRVIVVLAASFVSVILALWAGYQVDFKNLADAVVAFSLVYMSAVLVAAIMIVLAAAAGKRLLNLTTLLISCAVMSAPIFPTAFLCGGSGEYDCEMGVFLESFVTLLAAAGVYSLFLLPFVVVFSVLVLFQRYLLNRQKSQSD